MKTPEEIKKGLEICGDVKCHDCRGCPYDGTTCHNELNNDALAYIQQLEQRLVEVNKTSPRWISVKDREPEHDGLYYCHTAIWGDIMCRYANGRWVDDKAKFTNFPRRPTHWLEILDIPHPLEEENENFT